MKPLAGKVALVTGASKGIGAGIAKLLGAAGASVVVNYSSDRTGAEKVVSEIVSAGGKAHAVQANVGKQEDVRRLFQETAMALGPIDILVNNAGVYSFAPLADLEEAEMRRQFETNVFGLLLTCREALSFFPEDGGSIINIGTVGTKLNIPGSVIYTASKGAVDSITRVLANELAPRKIRVNAVNPGLVITEGTTSAGIVPGSDFVEDIMSRTPLGGTGTPQDIGELVMFFASNAARWISGQIVCVSGGM